MKTRILALALMSILGTTAAHAFPADGCEQERKEFPANWVDTTDYTTIMTCNGHYVRNFVLAYKKGTDGRIQLAAGRPDLMYRAVITDAQLKDIQAGKASLDLWSETSCFIRGDLSDSAALVISKSANPDDRAGFLAYQGQIDYFDECQ